MNDNAKSYFHLFALFAQPSLKEIESISQNKK